MADQWYYQVFGQEFGPLSFDELLAFAENGQLSAGDQVKLGPQGKWRLAGSIGRLMAVLPYAAAEKVVPAPPKPRDAATPAAAFGLRAAKVTVLRPVAEQPDTGADWGVANGQAKAGGADATIAAPAVTQISRPSLNSRSYASTNAGAAAEVSGYAPMPSPSRSGFGSSRPAAVTRHARRRFAASAEGGWFAGIFDSLAQPRGLGSVGAVAMVLLIAGWGYLPKSRAADIKRYQVLKALVDEIQSQRTSSPSALPALQQELEQAARQVVSAVKDQAGRDEPAKQCLLWAARDEVPRFLQAGLASESPAERTLQLRLQEAAYELGLQQRPVVAVHPQATSVVDD